MMTDAEKQEALTWTNIRRCMHGADPVTWNDAVTEHLENFLSGMSMRTMAHDNCYQIPPPAGPAGENLFASSNRRTPQSAVDAWYSEVNNCNGGPSGFSDGCQSGSGVTGHFTAMIWAGVTQIGCAYSNNEQVIGCRYWSGPSLSGATPNMGGGYVANVLPRSSTEAACAASGGAPAPSPPSGGGGGGRGRGGKGRGKPAPTGSGGSGGGGGGGSGGSGGGGR